MQQRTVSWGSFPFFEKETVEIDDSELGAGNEIDDSELDSGS